MKEYEALTAHLKAVEGQLSRAEMMLDYATDELLIDSLIYEIKSLYKRHAYYLGLIKRLRREAGEGCAV